RIDSPSPPRVHASSVSSSANPPLHVRLVGFYIQPLVYVPFSGPIDVRSVTPRTLWVQGPGVHAGLIEVVYDPRTHILEGTVDRQLKEDRRYTIVVSRGVKDGSGAPIASAARVP